MWSYNCARIYVGGYVGGGTNEDEKWIECKYRLLEGEILSKKMRPIRIKGMNSEGTIFTLETFVLFPKTETAIVTITNGQRNFTIQLVKPTTKRNTVFNLKL
jgi:hypothetical protein